jgi:hypothetical protein
MIARPPKILILFFIYLLTGLESQARFVFSPGFDFHLQRMWGRTAALLHALRFSKLFRFCYEMRINNMTTYGNQPTAVQPEQDQIPESAVRPTQSSQVEEAARPTGRHQITPAQEATLREMFGIQIRRLSVNECLDND